MKNVTNYRRLRVGDGTSSHIVQSSASQILNSTRKSTRNIESASKRLKFACGIPTASANSTCERPAALRSARSLVSDAIPESTTTSPPFQRGYGVIVAIVAPVKAPEGAVIVICRLGRWFPVTVCYYNQHRLLGTFHKICAGDTLAQLEALAEQGTLTRLPDTNDREVFA